jgi:hypothetical protein
MAAFIIPPGHITGGRSTGFLSKTRKILSLGLMESNHPSFLNKIINVIASVTKHRVYLGEANPRLDCLVATLIAMAVFICFIKFPLF